MENYRMGCSGNRPYNRTCGMNMPQPSNRNMNSSECSVRNTTDCSCTIPGAKEKKHEMFSHLQYLEPAMAYVPCQKFTENFPLQYALNAGTISHSYANHFVEREVFEDENRLLPKTVIKPY